MSRTGKAANFKFGRYIQSVHANESPLKIWEKRKRGRIQAYTGIAITKSRPLNKKKSVRCQSADPTITADLRPQSAVRTPLSASAVGGRTV